MLQYVVVMVGAIRIAYLQINVSREYIKLTQKEHT